MVSQQYHKHRCWRFFGAAMSTPGITLVTMGRRFPFIHLSVPKTPPNLNLFTSFSYPDRAASSSCLG